MRFGWTQRLIVAAIIAIVVFGCTRHSTNDPNFAVPVATSALAPYFPSAHGWTTVFNVTNGTNTGTLTFYVGGETSLQDRPAYRWLIIPSTGTPDTNYVVIGPTSLTVYQDTLASPEYILQAPLTSGSTWLRYPDQPIEVIDTTSILTDITGGKLDTTTTDPSVKKLLPVEGSNEVTVAAIEEVTTANDLHFTGAVKVSNTNRDGSTNSYWFVPGVGMVKYVIAATPDNPDGVTKGELGFYGLR
ncbi:hypothetical protein C3F09_00245 [candidate division GN15 bacterium]|uniref:Uncharacterized protein n=1 Tax=candidate division GN15 bacterium TaxID=2072418 RepID=A0A855XDU7_9BACT|nr:MAG: hypothetical protein C3F09_00245 [candidate division GN15 bacterium]